MSNRRWGQPPWEQRPLPLARAGSPYPEVAIIGGGLTGMSAAFHLARRGLRAVVFEAGEVGDGASGRTGGLVLEGTAAGVLEGASGCVPALEHLTRELRIDCDLQLGGCWEIEHGRRPDALMLPWDDGGMPIRIARMVAGGTVEPRKLLYGLAAAAIDAGANIFVHSPVRALHFHDAPVLELERQVIRPGHVVVAVNAWTSALVPGLPPLHSAHTFACATETLADEVIEQVGLGARIPFYTTDTPYLWGRVTPDNRLVFGAALAYRQPKSIEAYNIASGSASETCKRLERRVRALHPALSRVSVPSQWVGPIAFTGDAIPILARHPENPKVLIAGAYAGHGVAFSVHAGSLIARAIGDGESLPRWGAVNRRMIDQ